MPTISYFEVPVKNVKRAQKFYGSLLGWKFEKTGGAEDYFMIKSRAGRGECAIPGGLYKARDARLASLPIVEYVTVPSISRLTAKVKRLGGKVVVPKTTMEMGSWALVRDTEKNTLGLYEEKKGRRR